MKILATVLFLLSPLSVFAQFSVVSCTNGETGTCRQVVDCNRSNIQSTIAASASGGTGITTPNAFGGDGIYVPGGSCTWSSPITWSNKNIEILASNPTITISTSDAFQVSATNSGTTAAAFRISGFTFTGSGVTGHIITLNGGAPPNSGFGGYFRVDHINYNFSSGSGDTFVWYGPIFGLFDHLNGTTANKNHFLWAMFYNSEYPGSSSLLMGQGIATGIAAGLNGPNFTFVEDSSFACTSGYGTAAVSDSSSGIQRMVFRHNTVTGSCYNYAHWTRSGEWDGGIIQLYNNNYNCTASDCISSGGYPGRFGAGTGVIFNNTVNGFGTQSFQIDESRGCGAETSGFAGAVPNSNFDRSDGDASATGWPTAGQVGTACIAGSCTPATMDSVPFIAWNNGTQAGCSTGGSCTNSVGFNVDGSQGGGTCTRTMGNYLKSSAHTSSGGLNGAVDFGSFSAQPSNVGIYTGIATFVPYTYPHPLQGSSVATGAFFTMNEGVDTAASNGNLPSRNAYTNCATSCSGGTTPSPSPAGQLWCNSSQIVVGCGSFGSSAVASVLTGHGVHALDNGLGAGGNDSAPTVSAIYAQAIVHGCPVGTNIPSEIAGVTVPGETPAGHETISMTSGGSGISDTSFLVPSKLIATGADITRDWIEEGCHKINTTSVAAQHTEDDDNYNTTAGVYIGPGWDYDHPNSRHRYCPQSCSGWKAVKYQDVNTGTVTTTMPFPANHWLYYRKYIHINAGCTAASSSNCFFYTKYCQEDFTAGTAYNCWNLQDATTGLVPGGIPVNKTSFTRQEVNTQSQLESGGANANIVYTIDFKNLVMVQPSATTFPSVTKLGVSPI